MELTLDVNTEIYPVHFEDRFTLVLTSSLSLDGSPDVANFDQSGRPSLLDKYEYVMYGKIFNSARDDNGNVSFFASFGGLLMKLSGDATSLEKLKLDSRIYILIRKIS